MPESLSAAQHGVLLLLKAYKLLISPLFTGSCRFVPSCSDYAAEAVTRFGVVRGALLAGRRLARCRPLAAHGFDPVPGRWPRV
ncbi:MAG: membrane protein insertion efficiency factor YidD [Acidobacteria bacterium]|nr:membrane protein insertion efficiency factor YidD [Acidobacteriota bacterium]